MSRKNKTQKPSGQSEYAKRPGRRTSFQVVQDKRNYGPQQGHRFTECPCKRCAHNR